MHQPTLGPASPPPPLTVCADTEEYNDKLKEVEDVCNPIVAQVRPMAGASCERPAAVQVGTWGQELCAHLWGLAAGALGGAQPAGFMHAQALRRQLCVAVSARPPLMLACTLPRQCWRPNPLAPVHNAQMYQAGGAGGGGEDEGADEDMGDHDEL